MTTPPTNPDELPTAPLEPTHSVRWAIALALVLALLGYYFYAERAVGRYVQLDEPHSGRGLPPPTGPADSPRTAPR